MGNTYPIGDFTVVKSNPSTNVIRFTITDAANQLTTTKMIRAVLVDAMDQWIALERADLDTNGDDAIKGSDDLVGIGDGFESYCSWDFGNKSSDIALTEESNLSLTGNLTAEIPYGDV